MLRKYMSLRPTKAVFFDRDGVINELIERDNFTGPTSPFNLLEFNYLPNVKKAVSLVKKNFLTFVVTNQPHVGKDMRLSDLRQINHKIADDLAVDGIAYCIDKNSPRYKPSTGMFTQIVDDWSINCSNSFMIGDRWKDIVPAYNLGMTTIFIGNKYESPDQFRHIEPHYIVNDVLEACQKIVELQNE